MSNKTLRALIVEDDPLVRTVLVQIADWLGIESQATASGTEGMSALQGARFDLVLTDLRMPGAGGLAVARAAAALAPAPVVIVVSGYVTEEDEKEILAAGGSVLRKPFDAHMAKQAIETALAKREGAATLRARG